ncbi:MAG: ATP-binding protein [Maricaulaceae bacterium]|jgi:two-component system osmolarity sensor histidine kinase EnvZ
MENPFARLALDQRLRRFAAWARRPRRLKDYLPKSLFGRSLLIIVLPVAIMQVAVVYVFFEAHWQTVTARLSEGVAGEIQMVVDLYEDAGSSVGLATVRPTIEPPLGITVALEPGARLPTNVRSSFFRVLDRTLRRALSEKLTHDFWFDTTRYPAYVEVRVLVDEGVLRFIVPRDRVFATTGHIFLLWILGATVMLTAVSIIYIRNQAKPIERLARAAELFGRGLDAPDFRPSGAREVRQAATALLLMRERIERHVSQRTQLLAGVSHDLRTPLTRLKLELALLPPGEEVDEMRKDVEDMAAILNEYLDFSSGIGGEDPAPADIGEITRDAAQSAAQDGVEIEVKTSGDLVLDVRALALKRCLTNLVSNAANYASRVEIAAERVNDSVVIDIEDDGPGIPEELREEVFRPFNRLDEARSMNGSGVGLGLAIARDVARKHGGDVILSDSALGGLKARVRLPA